MTALVRSTFTYLIVSLYLLIAGPIGLGLAVSFRLVGVLYQLGHAGVSLGLKLAGIHYRVTGREHVDPTRAVVYCSNHVSNLDPPVLFQALHPRLKVLYKASLRKIPILGYALEVGGFVAVNRENREASFASIDRAVASIRAGNTFLIFPEGTRSRSDELLPFKKGGFVMAIKAQAPIVPVAISGSRDSMRRGSAVIHPVTVDVQIGEPIETAGLTVDDRDTLIEQVRGQIQAMLRR